MFWQNEPTAAASYRFGRTKPVGSAVRRRRHLQQSARAELPGVEFVGIADPDHKRAALVAQVHGCVRIGDVNFLIDLGLDAVTIVPTHLHREIALTCIARGMQIRSEDILSTAITPVGPFPPRKSNVGVGISDALSAQRSSLR